MPSKKISTPAVVRLYPLPRTPNRRIGHVAVALDVVSSLFARTAHYPRVVLAPGDGQVVLSAEARDARYYAAVPAEVRGPTVAIAVDASALSLASGNAASSVGIEIAEGCTVVRTDRGYEAPIAVYIGYSFGMPEVPSGAVAVEAEALASAIARDRAGPRRRSLPRGRGRSGTPRVLARPCRRRGLRASGTPWHARLRARRG